MRRVRVYRALPGCYTRADRCCAHAWRVGSVLCFVFVHSVFRSPFLPTQYSSSSRTLYMTLQTTEHHQRCRPARHFPTLAWRICASSTHFLISAKIFSSYPPLPIYFACRLPHIDPTVARAQSLSSLFGPFSPTSFTTLCFLHSAPSSFVFIILPGSTPWSRVYYYV